MDCDVSVACLDGARGQQDVRYRGRVVGFFLFFGGIAEDLWSLGSSRLCKVDGLLAFR